MNWLFMLISALCGGLATWFWSVRKVHRKIPQYKTETAKVASATAPVVKTTAVAATAVAAGGAASHLHTGYVSAADAANPHHWTIKGNTETGSYHTLTSPYYKTTKTDVWYETEADAQAAGLVRWDRHATKSAQPVGYVGSTDRPYGVGSAKAAADGSGPAGWAIKGNADSMLYHTVDSPSYKQTKAEAWFETEAYAQAAGFTRWDRRAAKTDMSAGTDKPVGFVGVADRPYGVGSAKAAADGSGPAGWAIKGNADSMLYHTVDSPSYKQTKAEAWFETEAYAQAAGFARWDRNQKKN